MKPIRKIKDQVICSGLKGWMLVSRSKLRLHAISGPDRLVFSGNPICISWQVSGCYKISINKRFILPGCITSVQLDSRQVPDLLQIQFFGIGQQIEKSFVIQKMSISLKKKHRITLPLGEHKKMPNHEWPELYTVMPLPAAQPPKLAIRQQALKMPLIPFYAPILGMQLQPYPLQPNQPEYETTVL